jgi:uncharacterized DUF497 family protein
LIHPVDPAYLRCYINAVEISFDPVKRRSNHAKHGLDLADAGELLDGRCLERIDDRYDYGEERWVSVGLLRGKVATCVWAEWGDNLVRVISLRRATTNEQEEYFRAVG